MNTKHLIILTWIFYLLGKDGPDQVWLFCAALGTCLSVCSFFYRIENRYNKPKK